MSPEYDVLRSKLDTNLHALTSGLRALGLTVLGGQTPIVSVLIGDEEDTLNAGSFLFNEGFYVQSVTFPAVPYHAGVLRIQINANHTPQAIEGLLSAIEALSRSIRLPGQNSDQLAA